jgi:retron-type reverse transcriptase
VSAADHSETQAEAFGIYGGVPQGDPLSPILYVIYLNALVVYLRQQGH